MRREGERMRKEKETRRRRRVGVGIGIINGTMIRPGDCCLFSPASLFSFPPSTTSTSTSTSTSSSSPSSIQPRLRDPAGYPLPLSPRPQTSHRLPLCAPERHAQSVPAIPPSSTHLRGGTLVSACVRQTELEEDNDNAQHRLTRPPEAGGGEGDDYRREDDKEDEAAEEEEK